MPQPTSRERILQALEDLPHGPAVLIQETTWLDASAGLAMSVEAPNELRSKLANADMQAAPQALLRASRRAREIARQTGTGIVIVRDGVLVEEPVGEIEILTPRVDLIHDGD